MKLLPRKLFLLLVVLMLWATDGSCSGIDVTNISLGTRNAGTGNAPINFDISWNNSWRSTGGGAPAPNNWDAAWVFVKFQKNGGDWAHASLNDTGHTVPAGASLDVGLVDTTSSFNISTNPGVGVFIYRSAEGTGTFSKTGFSLSWKYSQDGVDVSDTIVLRVYAIEMTYIPDGAFFAGDTSSSARFQQGSSDTDPWYIASEAAITTANAAGSGSGVAETAAEYYYLSSSSFGEASSGSAFTIPAAFPKGYQRFYMMKGEISQGQWVAFFNTLTSAQKGARDITDAAGKNSDALTFRNNVSWLSGDATMPDQGGGATYATVAMNYLSWADLTAYLDWAGLRPMSELEFERAARGPYRRVSGEYAWGTATRTQATSISNAGKSTEVPGAAANCVYGDHANVQGPMRVGAMADGDATRIEAGGGYYGNLDLSGNILERSVTVGRTTGRDFEGRYHGNGALDSNGAPNVSTWPGTSADGAGFRGGDWYYASASYLTMSRRGSASFTDATRWRTYGGRGVRSAP